MTNHVGYKFNPPSSKPTPTMRHLSKVVICKFCGKKAGIFDRWRYICFSKSCRTKSRDETREKRLLESLDRDNFVGDRLSQFCP